MNLSELAGTYLTIQFGQLSLTPSETSIVMLALAAGIVSGYHLWRIGYREDRQRRLMALGRAARDAVPENLPPQLPLYRRLGSAVAASALVGASERERLLGVLSAAGITRQGRLASFVASKLCGAVALAALVWLFIEWRQLFATMAIAQLVAVGAGLMLGWRLPDMILSRLAARRRLLLEQGMPDALDLLVICAEAGLGLNQAIDEISSGLRPSNRHVAEEFAIAAAEMRVEPDLAAALDNLVRRTGIDSLRGVIITLKQSMRFGTPLAESLRTHAAEMRTARQARMEERAARLPVLLAIPIMLFVLPSLLMVIATPVAIRIFDTFKTVTFGAP